MANKLRSLTADMAGQQVNVAQLGLGVAKPGAAPSIVLVGATAAAGTGANSAGVSTGGVAARVFTVEYNGTTYYCPLFSSNA